MDQDLRKKLHAIRERITKGFNECDSRERAIQSIQANLAVVQAGAEQSQEIAAAVPAIEAMAQSAIAEHRTAQALCGEQLADLVG